MTKNRAQCQDCGRRYNAYKDCCPHCEAVANEISRKEKIANTSEYHELNSCETVDDLKNWLLDRLMSGNLQ